MTKYLLKSHNFLLWNLISLLNEVPSKLDILYCLTQLYYYVFFTLVSKKLPKSFNSLLMIFCSVCITSFKMHQYTVGSGDHGYLFFAKIQTSAVETIRKFKFLVKVWSIWKFSETFGVLDRPFTTNGINKKKLMTKLISKFDSFEWLFR